MFDFTAKVHGLQEVGEMLRGVATRMSNLSPILKAIGDRAAEQTKRRIESGGPAPDGAPWAPPKRPDPRRRNTLRVTGQLRDSIRYQMIGDDTVAIGTNKIYAAIHQLGGQAGRGHAATIPARPYLGFSTADIEEINKIISEWVMSRR